MDLVWRELFRQQNSLQPELPAALLEPLQQLLQQAPAGWAQARSWQPQLVRTLQQLALPGWLIAQLLSDHNDLLYRVAIDEAMGEMDAEGWGPPPVRFCVLVMGSGGRHESLLHPDQDNALILEDYPLERHNEIDAWFRTLAERFTARLDQANIPYCKGDVMASRPLWRKPISEWKEQMRLWMATRRVKLVQLCNILFDFAPVYGDEALAQQLRDAIQAQVPTAGLFLHEMAELFDESPVALDRFERLHGDGKDAPHPSALNLKRQGLLPLTAALRLLALKKGCPEVSCRARLAWLDKAGVLQAGQARVLTQVFERLLDRLLQAQLARAEREGLPDNWIDQVQLDDFDQRQLQWDLKQIRTLQQKAVSL